MLKRKCIAHQTEKKHTEQQHKSQREKNESPSIGRNSWETSEKKSSAHTKPNDQRNNSEGLFVFIPL